MVEFKDLLRQKMNEKGLMQKELAFELGIDPSLVSKWLRGTAYPSPKLTRRLAKIIDYDERELFEIVEWSKERYRERLQEQQALAEQYFSGKEVSPEKRELVSRFISLIHHLPMAMMYRLLDICEEVEEEDLRELIAGMEIYLRLARRRRRGERKHRSDHGGF